MSTTTELLDRWKKAKGIVSDNGAALALRAKRQTISNWRMQNTHAEIRTIIQMSENTRADPAEQIILVAADRERDESTKKQLREIAKKIKKYATLLILASAIVPMYTYTHCIQTLYIM